MKRILSLFICAVMVISLAASAFAISNVGIKSISLAQKDISIKVGETYYLNTLFTPKNTTQKLLKHSTSNQKIVEVDARGKLSAVNTGKVTITVTSVSNPKAITKCNVTVSPNGLAPVKLVGYLPGDEQKDNALVMEQFNKKLKKEINATVDIKYIGWGDFFQKYPLILASGEEFDFAFIANWADYAGQAQKGAFLDISKLVPKYAPDIWKIADKDAWKSTTVKGKIFGIPTDGSSAFNNQGIMYREDLRIKYKVPEIKKMEDFEAYMDAIVKNEKNMKPVLLNSIDNNYLSYWTLFEKTGFTTQGFQITSGILGYAGLGYGLSDPSAKLKNMTQTKEYKDVATLMNKWYKKGFWTSSDMVSKDFNTDTATSKFGLGKAAMEKGNTGNYFNVFEAWKKTNPTWKAGFYYPKSPTGNVAKTDALQNGMAVSPTSKNPERALMFINKALTGYDYKMLLTFGIKDKHFSLDKTGYPELPKGVTPDKTTFGHWSNAFSWFLYEYADTMPSKTNTASKATADIKSSAIAPALIGFNFDTSECKSEIASVNDVLKQYEIPLSFGITKNNIDTDLKTLNSALKSAGQDKIITEAQKQCAKYIMENKK